MEKVDSTFVKDRPDRKSRLATTSVREQQDSRITDTRIPSSSLVVPWSLVSSPEAKPKSAGCGLPASGELTRHAALSPGKPFASGRDLFAVGSAAQTFPLLTFAVDCRLPLPSSWGGAALRAAPRSARTRPRRPPALAFSLRTSVWEGLLPK
jgi:hypothetical protein